MNDIKLITTKVRVIKKPSSLFPKDKRTELPVLLLKTMGLLISLLALFIALTRHMRPGHFFNEDYAVYLQESQNLLSGRSLTDMGIHYWFDQDLSLTSQSPLSYPPLIPILFAFPLSIFGLNLEALKLFQACVAVAGLAVAAAAMLRSGLVWAEVLASLLLFAFAPCLARDANTIGADLPFILCQAAAMLAALSLQRAPTRVRALRAGVALGVAFWLSISARTAAVALVPAVVLADIVVHRRVRAILLLPLLTMAALWFIQSLLIGRTSAYSFIMHYRFFDVLNTGRTLIWALGDMFQDSPVSAFAVPIVLMITLLAGIGITVRAAVGCPIAWWLAAYTALLLVLPNFSAGTRYLLPHLVFGGAFAARGAWTLLRVIPLQPLVRRTLAQLPALGFAACCALVPSWPAGPLPFGVGLPSTTEAFARTRAVFVPDEIVAATVHRSLHLYTGRTTIRPPEAADAEQVRAWLDANSVAGAVLKYSPAKGRYDISDCPITPICRVGAEALGLHEVFRNEDWVIWRRDINRTVR